jgi:hypothetical protein
MIPRLTPKDTVAAMAAPATVWHRLAAPVDPTAIQWRKDSEPKESTRGGFYSRYVAYIDAGLVRERLDEVVPGEWSLTVVELPPLVGEPKQAVAFKAQLTIQGVTREDVGVGKDYKQASTDAFKRAAVRFGIGHEMYAMPKLYIEMDGADRWAKPTEDPAMVYALRHPTPTQAAAPTVAAPAPAKSVPPAATAKSDVPPCPKCGTAMWDNRGNKKNPNGPDFRCSDKMCRHALWVDSMGAQVPAAASPAALPRDPRDDDDDAPLPF